MNRPDFYEGIHPQLDCDIAAKRREEYMQKLEAREQLWRDYVAFLEKADKMPYDMALIHGWRCPDEDVERGKQFREKLNIP